MFIKLLSNSLSTRLILVAALSIAVAAIDFQISLGIAIGMLYVIPVMLTYYFESDKATIVLGVLFSVLISAGLLKRMPALLPDYVVYANRLMSVFVVWAAVAFVIRHKMKNRKIELQKREFETLSVDYAQQLDTLNAAAIVSMTDSKGTIIAANDLFCKISKYSKEELIGNSHRILKSGQHPDSLYSELWKTIRGGEIWQGEICNKAKDGSLYWVYTTIAPFLNRDGVIERFVSVRFDMTPQKNQEIALRQKTKEIEHANEELEAFSYSVSHDLRAPLRAIEGFAKALKEGYSGKMDPEADRWLNFIMDNATRMDSLIRDILAFSRISRSEITRHKTDTGRLIRDEFDNLHDLLSDRAIKLELSSNLPDVYGDVNMLRLVFQNLLSNSMKYCVKEQPLTITVTGGTDNGMCWYSIADNGIGFDEKYKDKIFGVFQRLHPQDTYEGTGVGLAIVDRIVNKHSGYVTAQSTPGQGSVFTIFLPFSE